MQDLFISYSHDDIKWVQDSLLPMIESWELDFAIDYEDFLPGRSLPTLMLDHVTAARHVIFVCTKSFVASRRCQEELQEARYQDPARFDGKAIPIVLDGDSVPPLLRSSKWCNLSKNKYDVDEWKTLCKAVGGTWSASSDRILKKQNDLSQFFGSIRDNESRTTILALSHAVQELTGIRDVLSVYSHLGLSHIYTCLAEVGKTKGLELILSTSDEDLSTKFDENLPQNLIIFGQTAQGNRILYRVSNGLFRYKQTQESPKYCYEIRGQLFVPNQDRMSFIIYNSRTEPNHTVLVLFSTLPAAKRLAAQYFAQNYLAFVNKERDGTFLNIYEVEEVDKDPVLILSER